ncbi:hypothetical protein QQS21_002233 [Conoideocrella luteorostrata]|uniref:Zn(2)-C6 fungal-type domain-containing protein n=1 Tax=Conoideocrella luteorostrata TaxID=1105319 RepID=A0AAJ0CVK0_9HYPO|nr:hypothetical protein QQS21_002233 [Conoideocrella luteorostrata]
MQNQARKLRRTANACVPCRQSKIKCSGEEPCANCQRRFVNCRFEDGGNKISVPERYLRELQKKAKQQQPSDEAKFSNGSTSTPASELDDGSRLQFSEPPPLVGIDVGRSIWTSPFAQPSTTTRSNYKSKRNWVWLAPSSAWSFTARLTILMTDKLSLDSPDNSPAFLFNEVYDINWIPPSLDGDLDISCLPSFDYALYLVNTVKFHLGQNYWCFDEQTFNGHLQEFYFGNPSQKAADCRLWYVQFLIVLAFGKAFLSQSASTGEPPGAKYFIRAMSLLPDITMLWKESLLAIEILALAGLYLYCIDRRESANVYVGQAIRIAHMEGLHTELPEDELGQETVARCRQLWWTLYIMDRHFSSSLGVPMSTQDSEIETPLDPPNTSSQQDSSLSMQVKLSRLLSFILTNVYKTERTQLGMFLETTRSILQSLAGYAQEIENIFQQKFKSSVDAMSKETRHITLLYHQCVIVATRPVLLSVLRERLDKLGAREEDWQTFLTLTKPLITTGIKSAAKTLQILSAGDGLLETFLPFDLEFTYGAAVHLAMAKGLFPDTDEHQPYSEQVHSILGHMIARGNKVAELRKAEFSHIEYLFDELAKRAERSGLQTLTLVSPENIEDITITDSLDHRVEDEDPNAGPMALDQGLPRLNAVGEPLLHPPLILTNNEFLDDIGISSYEFLSIVNQMGYIDNYESIL